MRTGQYDISYRTGSLFDDYSVMLNALPAAAMLVDDKTNIVLHNQKLPDLLDDITAPFIGKLTADSQAKYTTLPKSCRNIPLTITLRESKTTRQKNFLLNVSDLELSGRQYRLLVLNEQLTTPRKSVLVEDSLVRRALADIPGSAIYIIDTEYRCLLAEGDWTVLPGFLERQPVGKFIYDVLDRNGLNIFLPLTEKVFNNSGSSTNKELNWKGLHFLLRATALNGDNGELVAAVITVTEVSQVKSAQMELAKLNDSLERKVTQRTEELTSANSELEAFSYSVSHDLRTPLRAMSGYAQMLKEMYDQKIDDNGKRLLNNIITGASTMGRLIDDLLSFSRISRKDLVHQQVNMISMVNECIAELSPSGDNTQIKVAYLPVCSADPAMIKQVWLNLIGNAIKYSSKNQSASVSIGSKKQPNEYVFFVKDNGVGFDMKYADKLFGVFQRLHGQSEFEGTGIGLALVKRIIEKHNGRVWAESAEGEGATFYFSLPQLF